MRADTANCGLCYRTVRPARDSSSVCVLVSTSFNVANNASGLSVFTYILTVHMCLVGRMSTRRPTGYWRKTNRFSTDTNLTIVTQ